MAKWPWSRDEKPSEAELARAKAERDLADVQATKREVKTVVGSLRRLRQENHFRADVEAAWEGYFRD